MFYFKRTSLMLMSVFIGSGLLLFAAQSSGQDAALAGEGVEGPYMRRPSFVVRNIEESLKFYRDILGYRVNHISEGEKLAPNFYTIYNIPNDGKGRFAALNSNKTSGEFALAEYAGYQPVEDETAVRSAVLLLNANGHLDEIVAKAKAGGYTVLPAYQYSETGRELGILDHDGHLVVLYENTLYLKTRSAKTADTEE